MLAAVRLISQVRIFMLVTIVVYAVVGEMLSHQITLTPANTLFHAISLLSISLVGAAIVVRRTLILRSETSLQQNSNDAVALSQWRIGYFVLYALCETLGLFGLLLRIDGFPLANVWGFYLGGIVLLLLYAPRIPRA